MDADRTGRARFTAALRQLADHLDAHPDIPVPGTPKFLVFPPHHAAEPERRGFVDQAAAALGVTAADDNYGHYLAIRRFGPLVFEVLEISDAARARHQAEDSYRGNISAALPAITPAATAAAA